MLLAAEGTSVLKDPDIDLSVSFLNRWGEVIKTISTKTRSTDSLPGITMGVDNRTGVGEEGNGDDEQFVLELLKIHPCVHFVSIAMKVQNRASLSFVNSAYFRMLEVEPEIAEKEMFRHHLENHRFNPNTPSIVVARLEKTSKGWVVNIAPFRKPTFPKLPRAVRLRDFSALIPATDGGGTSDPCLQISHLESIDIYVPETTLTPGFSKTIGHKRVIDVASKVQSKVPCPTTVNFPDVMREEAISTMVGKLGHTDIWVVDKGALQDDVICKHNIDLTWLCPGITVMDSLEVRPADVKRIVDLDSNIGFTSGSVRLYFTIELLFG